MLNYIRDLTLDINFSLKKLIDLICNNILNLKSIIYIKL